MTSADVRDMLDLPQDGHPRAPPAKKQKTVEKRPEGITRELFALLGERAPPVAISDHVKYKGRPKWTHKTQRWEMAPFTNPARTDGLVLHHWQKKIDPKPAPITTPAETSESSRENQETKPSSTDSSYYFAKYNVSVTVPEYTDSEYEASLQHEDWTKEETDYLIDLCKEYGLRWVVIADRYDYQPPPNAEQVDGVPTALVTAPKTRTMEVLKARYYGVARRMMEVRTPVPNMAKAEFELYEKTKFNASQEATRKEMAKALLSRTTSDLQEEEILLTELRRILNTQDKLLEDRKELYIRLESPQNTGAHSRMYDTSQGLNQLIQMLAASDRGKKRRSIAGLNGSIDMGSSPAIGSSSQNAGVGSFMRDGKDTPRDSLGGPGSSVKKGAAAALSERRKLTAQEERIYGVSHHDRLTSGVQFRNDRVLKLVQAKSNIQAQRVQSALAQLEIPAKLVMPTARVCAEYERLVQNIHVLLDIRKVCEKVEGEIKVLQAQKEERERRERQERGEPEPERELGEENAKAVEDIDSAEGGHGLSGQVKEEKEEEANTGIDGRDAVGSSSAATAPATAAAARPGSGGGHKRSASVMSAMSEKSSKRQKK
ncbi:MAG: swr complex subunit [Trichoglossum hirsutum]|nr:MAG: swr complex subunit [Trichoglossum hirsutum]